MPRLGTRKLHFLLTPLLKEHGIEVGRDYLFNLLEEHRMLIRQRRRTVITTNSRHWMHKYTNLVKEMVIDRPEQLWVSDITYIRLINQWGYLSLITDAYSRKIMGHCFRTDMSAQGCIDALEMALANRQNQGTLIHHSDRGSQYCSALYVSKLNDHRIRISMTENGDPYENALAERVNGILKSEFNLYESKRSFEATAQYIDDVIKIYNKSRPHSSCDLLTPQQAHQKQGIMKKKWKEYRKNYHQIPTQDTQDAPKVSENSLVEAGAAPIIKQDPASIRRETVKTH